MKKYLVIGNPIEHSLSPKLHNYWLKENNIDAVYDKKKLDENELKNIISEVKEGKINGINVTVPFKKAVIPFLDKLSPEAENTQSVNTIYLNNGKIIGHNTDIAGFELSIKKIKYDVTGKKVLILGAGGVVSSIISALYKMKAFEVAISNRTKEKAENLKNLFKNLVIVDWGNIYDFDMNLQEAIDTPRAFALNGKLKVENSFSKNSVEDLSKLGHDVEIVKDGIGGGQAIMIDRKEGILIGASDPRKDGLAIGY